MLEFVSATRRSLRDFHEHTLLGRSLRRLSSDDRIGARISVDNSAGLPEVYNKAIDHSEAEVLAFTHDDIWIDDLYVVDRLVGALRSFDVVGVAGNRRVMRDSYYWWAYREKTDLVGSIAHGPEPLTAEFQRFGNTQVPAATLDGVFIAARLDRLRQTGVRFDERFRFHLYDMDFCRTALNAGLKLGVWSIPLTHAGTSNVHSEGFREGMEIYRDKWKLEMAPEAFLGLEP